MSKVEITTYIKSTMERKYSEYSIAYARLVELFVQDKIAELKPQSDREISTIIDDALAFMIPHAKSTAMFLEKGVDEILSTLPQSEATDGT